ncbi:uncharacterized protein DUF4404 [Fluviicoccus keumensis]|uniref:Uncharacterized protein DUF4404 n=1 Tax=Fluviicoccus keumensis TaxID=1435465 RepID=A0A4Q7ZAX3_9GAMM|nr:DUF4404 family protein [Fluviicoccus keumensis]RZU47747.1 uncharacterized protein DUF4404 [Fluviicoccus keumensis]
MSKQLIGDEIARARSHLQQQPLPPAHQDELTRTLADMELHLQVPEPAKTEEFLDTLRGLEARVEAEHPLLAGVLGNLVRLLGNMGV